MIGFLKGSRFTLSVAAFVISLYLAFSLDPNAYEFYKVQTFFMVLVSAWLVVKSVENLFPLMEKEKLHCCGMNDGCNHDGACIVKRPLTPKMIEHAKTLEERLIATGKLPSAPDRPTRDTNRKTHEQSVSSYGTHERKPSKTPHTKSWPKDIIDKLRRSDI